MKKAFVIYSMSRVKGSSEAFKNKEILFGFEDSKTAEKNCKRLNGEENKDQYLEFHYYIEPVIIY